MCLLIFPFVFIKNNYCNSPIFFQSLCVCVWGVGRERADILFLEKVTALEAPHHDHEIMDDVIMG